MHWPMSTPRVGKKPDDTDHFLAPWHEAGGLDSNARWQLTKILSRRVVVAVADRSRSLLYHSQIAGTARTYSKHAKAIRFTAVRVSERH